MCKHSALTGLLRLTLAFALFFPIQPVAAASSFRVGPGDLLFIDFPLKGTPSDLQPFGGNGLTLIVVGSAVYSRYEVKVAPDGFISLPAMAPIFIQGNTVEAVRELIVKEMRSPLHSSISVTLAKTESAAYFIHGEVENPGRYAFERPTTLIEAIGAAGGTKHYGKTSKILLLREGQAPQHIDLSYEYLKEHGAPQIALLPSDQVVVPRRWFYPDNTLVFFILSALGTSVAVYAAVK